MSIGTFIELLLLGHTESLWQVLPVFMLGLFICLLLLVFVNQTTILYKSIFWLSVIHLVLGFMGTIMHFQGNVAFEKEMYPSIGGWKLFSEAMTGATPALAPGSLMALAVFGLAFTHISNRKKLTS